MHKKGGVCEELANIGYSLLNRSEAFRVFPQASYRFTGAAGGINSPGSWAIVSQDVVGKFYDSSHQGKIENKKTNLWYNITLQGVLAHELDHLANRPHIIENGVENPVLTPNMKACSDIDMGNGTP